MSNDIITNEKPIDLWDINPILGKKIDELICLRSKCKNVEEYLNFQLEAWELIPKPATQFYTPTGALALGISDSFFKLGRLSESLEWALIAYEARKNMMSAIYPISLGIIYYELNDLENAYKYFAITYDMDKYSPFAGEDKKYWQFYKEEKEKRK